MISSPEVMLKEIKEGDKEAFKALFDLYYTELCRFALIYVKDKDSAEEVVQNFFVHFWEKREVLSINSSLKSYFYSSIRNRSLNHIRNNSKFIKIDDDKVDDLIYTVQEQESILESNELRENINKAINNLPPKCKEIFLLSRGEQMSYHEISEKLNISPKTVENQISIALKKLHSDLKPYYNLLLILFVLFYDF